MRRLKMTTIKHNNKEISFGMWDTFNLNEIVEEFNKKHNLNLRLVNQGQNKMRTMKKKLVITGLGVSLLYLLNNGCLNTESFAQEGTIDNKLNEKISTPTNVSYTIKEEQKSLEELSNEINESFQENLANSLEIGGKPAYKEIINGQEYYFVEGFNYAFLKLKLGNNILPTPPASVNYAIEQGFKEAVSIMGYNPKEINFFNKSIEKQGEDTYAYIKTNIKNTKSSAQNKEE